MYTVLLSIHILLTVFLIGIILVQRNASDANGLSGSSNTSFMSGRAAASFITRTTALLATGFICTSLGLGILTAHSHATEGSIMDSVANSPPGAVKPLVPAAPSPLSPAPTPITPAKPTVPRPE